MKNSAKGFFNSKNSTELNKLYSVPKNEKKTDMTDIPVPYDFHTPVSEKITRSQQLYDRAIKYGASWSFVILFCILLAAFIIFSIGSYLYL